MTPATVSPADIADHTPAESTSADEPVDREAFYIRSGSDAVYAMVHHPTGVPSGVAVLMCPDYGWEDLCIHRVKFRWATELAAAGHTVLRFDAPGDGDSSGDSLEPDQVQRWVAATRAAALWLRQSGVKRIVGFGIGLGALLACLATADDAPIDDLILWKFPLSGRSLAREIQLGATVSFASGGGADPRSGATGEDGGDLLHGGFIDECGRIMTGETFNALAAVNLKEISLPDAPQRNALLFAGTRGHLDRTEQRSADWLRDCGVTLTIADGDEYQAMMRYVLFADTPRQAISETVKWLSTLPTEPTRPDEEPDPVIDASAALEFDRDGGRIRDRPIAVRVMGYALHGVVSEPVSHTVEPVTVVYFDGSADRRIGPNRAWVEASRRWAARGVRGVRVDLPGIGDSDGADDIWRTVYRHFHHPAHQQVVSLLDALQNRGLGQRFVLVGFCSSAVKSLQVSFTDRRVVGVFSVNPPFLLPSRIDAVLRDWWVHEWEPKPTTSQPRVKIMRAAQLTLSGTERAYRSLLKFGPRRLDIPKHKIWQSTARGTHYVFLIKPKYRFRSDVVDDPRSDRLQDLRQVEVDTLPDNDERFRTLTGQRFVSEHFDAMLARILAQR